MLCVSCASFGFCCDATTQRSDQIIAMAVIIFGFWNVPIVRNCINPLKLFTIGWHELCHISAVSPYFVLIVHRPKTAQSCVGHSLWRAHTENHHRPACRGCDNCGRRTSFIHSVCRVHRFHVTWRTVCTCRLGHACREDHELCSGGRPYHALGPCTRQVVSIAAYHIG